MKCNVLVRRLPAWLFVAALLSLLTGVAWRLAHRPTEADPLPGSGAPGGLPATLGPTADIALPASPALDETATVATARSPLADAVVLEEQWPDASASPQRPTRVRLVRLASTGQMLRLVDRYYVDSTGERELIATDVMRADAVLVAVPAGRPASEVAARLRAAGFAPVEPGDHDAVVSVRLPEASLDEVPAALTRLGERVPDLLADPDYLRFPSQVVSDDYDTTRLWGLEKIEAPAAWTVSTGSVDVVVGIIDSGITVSHPDLAANLWTNPGELAGNGRDDDGNGFVDDIHGWNFASNNTAIADSDGHGTHVSGTIGASGNNGVGVTGVNWRVKLMALRAGSGSFTDSALLNALRYAVQMRQKGVNIVAVNMSLGGTGSSASFRQELVTARDAGLLVVAAAGNLDTDTPTADNDAVPLYPASYDVDSVIAVASTNQGDSLSIFSHYGAVSVDLAAPGTAIFSTVTGGGYQRISGTSMAAPHVAGAVALVAAANPGLSGAQIRTRILDTVDRLSSLVGKVASGGRLNLRRAVAPGLVVPRIAVRSGDRDVDVAALDRPGLPLDLRGVLLAEGGVTPAATITWTMEEGPAAATFSPPTGDATQVTFPATGRYRLRATAVAGPLRASDDLVVAVGSDTASPGAGLQAWWRFDDTGGTTADSSGQGHPGTILGGTRTSIAALGTAINLDGAGNTVRFSSPTLSRVTIAGWVRATGVNNLTIFPRVVHMREGMLFGGFDPFGNSGDDGNINTLKFALDQVGADAVWHSPPGSLQVGPWSHVAVTFDPSAINPAPVFYINGVSQLTGTQNSTAVTTPTVAQGVGYIGDRGDGTRGWLGQLDEIRLYDRVLSAGEIAWMAHEVTLQSLAGGAVTATATDDPLTWTVSFSAATTGFGVTAVLDPKWTVISGNAVISAPGSATTSVLFSTPGSHRLRFDGVSSDGVLISRTLDVTVVTTPVDRAGYYTGATSTGGQWVLLVRADNTATFFASGQRGSFQRDFAIPETGVFDIVDRSGARVLGRIFADGSVSGSIDSAGTSSTFSGVRSADDFGAADPGRDGIYSGWLVDTSVRAAALVERGRIVLAIEESGNQRVAVGSIDTAGAFALVPGAGATFDGVAGGGRLEGTVVVPGKPARSMVLWRDGTVPARRLVNLSVRGFVGTGENVLIPGFVIRGGSLPVLVRGIGPGLVPLGVPANLILGQPAISLRRGQTLLQQNVGWDADGHAAEIVAATTSTGAFALVPGAADCALTSPLSPELYTVRVEGVGGSSGIALAEVYDAGPGTGVGELVNLSGRAQVGQGDNILIGGFVVDGDAPVLVLVRAAGPALVPLGVGGVLAQPHLRVVRLSSEIAANTGWENSDSPATVAAAAAQVGAFAFPSGSADSALVLSLPPGAYTAQVSGADGGTGVALLEIYRVDGM